MIEPDLSRPSLLASMEKARASLDERENAELRDRDSCKCSAPRGGGRVYLGRAVCLLCSGLMPIPQRQV